MNQPIGNPIENEVFKAIDNKILEYFNKEQVSEKEKEDILKILLEYKQLVVARKIDLQHPQRMFRDVLDLHEHKQKKLREKQKEEEQKEEEQKPKHDPTIVTKVYHLIDKTAKKYGIKKKSDEFKELHDQADSVLEDMTDLDGKAPEQFVEALFDIIVGDLPDKKTQKTQKTLC